MRLLHPSGFFLCDQCGTLTDGRTDDNYNSDHSKIQCVECAGMGDNRGIKLTNILRKKIAKAYRSRLNRGMEKKLAMLEVTRLFRVSRRSV